MEYSYDDSAANPHNPSHPPRRVLFGQQSVDERGELWIQALTTNSRDRVALEKDLQQKMLSEMIGCYEFRISLDPQDASAHCHLGTALLATHKPRSASPYLKRAIELDPQLDEPHPYLGMIRLDENKLDEAEAKLQTVERPSPNNYLAHGLLGLVAMNKGKLARAESHLRAALRLNPNDTVAQENLKRVRDAVKAQQ